MDQPEYVFHVHAALRKSKGVWAENEIRFLGQLSLGPLSIGDTIRIPLIGGGYVNAKVARFTEDLTDEWFGLPFYDTVQPAAEPFCICVDEGPGGHKMIKVPSVLEKYAENRKDDESN